jgi:hypothetical protein
MQTSRTLGGSPRPKNTHDLDGEVIWHLTLFLALRLQPSVEAVEKTTWLATGVGVLGGLSMRRAACNLTVATLLHLPDS